MGRAIKIARHELRDALVDCIPEFGRKVYVNRTARTHPRLMPCAVIFTPDEDIEDGHNDRSRKPQITIQVEVAAGAELEDPFDDLLDELLERVEEVIDSGTWPRKSLLAGARFRSTRYGMDSEGEKLVAFGLLTIELPFIEQRPKGTGELREPHLSTRVELRDQAGGHLAGATLRHPPDEG